MITSVTSLHGFVQCYLTKGGSFVSAIFFSGVLTTKVILFSWLIW
uniref:Uncharacterized protein n=1 Tax=Rhizophora mucronata TaxID=61149 RepID=A0A2P2IY11_RHIMU